MFHDQIFIRFRSISREKHSSSFSSLFKSICSTLRQWTTTLTETNSSSISRAKNSATTNDSCSMKCCSALSCVCVLCGFLTIKKSQQRKENTTQGKARRFPSHKKNAFRFSSFLDCVPKAKNARGISFAALVYRRKNIKLASDTEKLFHFHFCISLW